MNSMIRLIRFIRKHQLQFALNIFGLSFGMAVFIVIQLYIGNEKDYDKFWTGHNSIFRISALWDTAEGTVRRATLPPPMGPALEEYTAIKTATRILYWSDFTLRPDIDSSKVFRETNAFIADKHFFNVFQNRLIVGDEHTALKNPGSIILSESAVRKYFGDIPVEEVLDHSLLGGKDAGTGWTITGVMRDIPQNSHMNFDILVSMWPEFSQNTNWSWHIMHTYVRVDGGFDANSFSPILSSLIQDKLIPYFVQEGFLEASSNPENYRLEAINLSNIHLSPDWEDSIQKGAREEYLDILNFASILVFLLACINFINISTALSFYRIGEVGVRKIHGASRIRLLRMVITEYALQVFLALLFGLCLTEFMTIMLHQFFDVTLHRTLTDMRWFIFLLCLILLTVTIAASVFPAWLLIRGRFVTLANANLSFARGKGFRNGLIVFQFFIVVLLLGFAFTISNQLDYIRTRDLGFNKHNLIIIQNDREIEEQRQVLINEGLEIPGVSGISFTTGIPGLLRYHIRDIREEGNEAHFPMQWYEIDQHYLDVMEIEVVDGKGFEGKPVDSTKILLNQTAVRMLGLDEPVGEVITINEGSPDEHTVTVSGVIRDFNQEGFHLQVQPLVLEYLDNYVFKDYIAIRYENVSHQEITGRVEELWSDFEPQVPASYSFLTDRYNRLHSSELLLSRIISYFSTLSMIIAGIGLFGVSSVAIEQKKKEIGIRKVFGASVYAIIKNQLNGFLRLVLFSIVLALPLSLYVSTKWLESFIYRADINPWLFILTTLITLCLTTFVVGFRSLSASLKNPIHSLSSE